AERELNFGSSKRMTVGSLDGSKSRTSDSSTILPRSLPLYCSAYRLTCAVVFGMLYQVSSSPLRNSGANHRSAVTFPRVEPDQALGVPCSGEYTGRTMLAEKRVSDQPRPKVPHFSRCALLAPQDFSVLTAHSDAARNPGEFVRRGPLASVSQNRWS